MREIKCRVYSKEKKRLVCCYQEGLIFHLDTGQLYSASGMNVTDNYVLYQYTGLKDKNGVEIYEGDIVHGFDRDGDRSWRPSKVSFIKGAFVLGKNSPTPFNRVDGVAWEVIGNIYENPELLETKE